MRYAEMFRRAHKSLFTLRFMSAAFTFALMLTATQRALSQTIGWGTPLRDSSTQTGGELDRQGYGAVVFNGSLWVAYIGPTSNDQYGDAYVYTANNTGGSTFGNKAQVYLGNGGGPIQGSTNPALAVYQGKLYLAYNDAYGNSRVIHSNDGYSWSSTPVGCASNADASPAMAAFGPYLYVGLRDHASQSLTMCVIRSDDSLQGITSYAGIRMNFNPTLAVFNNTLYMSLESIDNTHFIDLYTSVDGFSFTESRAAAGDQTSTAPSLAVHNNVLYLGFRENDSRNKFLYKYSTDGVNFTGAIDPHWAMGGPPTLASGDALNGQLYMFFSSGNSQPLFLCSNHGY